MQHQSLEQITAAADVHAALLPGPDLSRRERLERWAAALERQPARRLRSIEGTEFGLRDERAAKRADNSPLTVAFEDPALRAAGLRGDRVGDAVAFFGLTQHEVHHLVCYCHHGRTIAPTVVAARVRDVARQAEAWTLPRARTVAAGVAAAAAAVGLALAVL